MKSMYISAYIGCLVATIALSIIFQWAFKQIFIMFVLGLIIATILTATIGPIYKRAGLRKMAKLTGGREQ